MVARAGTLVPISRKCEQLHTRCFPGFSQHRRCVIARGRRRRRAPQPGGPPPPGAPLGGRRQPSEGLAGLLRAGEGPRRSGGLRVSLRSLPGRPPGPRCSSRRALRRSRFRCPSGFPFSLSPSLYLHSIDRHPPVSSPSGVSFATLSSAIRRRRLPSGKTKGSSSQLPARNLPERNLPACHLTTQ